MQIANVTSLAAESGPKLIEKLTDEDEKFKTESNNSSEDEEMALWIRNYGKKAVDDEKIDIKKTVINVSKNGESPDKSGMTNISEESRPPKRMNATAATTTLIAMPTTSSTSLQTSKSAAATTISTSTPTTPYVALQITDVIPMKHVQNNQYVLALKWTKMPNSSSSASTSPTASTTSIAPFPVENKPEIAQSMPIVSEIDDKNVAAVPETTKINQTTAHLMVNTPDEKMDEPKEHQAAKLAPKGRVPKTDVAEIPEGPDDEWGAGYAPVNKLPKLAPKPKHGTSASSMYRHLSRLGGNERTCDVCNKTFSDR